MVDLNGIMRGKRIPANRWQDVCEWQCLLPVPVHHGYDMRCLGYTTGQFREWISGFSHYAGNETSPHPVGTGRGHVFARSGMDHKPVPVDPRQALSER